MQDIRAFLFIFELCFSQLTNDSLGDSDVCLICLFTLQILMTIKLRLVKAIEQFRYIKIHP